jgi:hypothetical protein
MRVRIAIYRVQYSPEKKKNKLAVPPWAEPAMDNDLVLEELEFVFSS